MQILVYWADGYTESSSLALCMLMALRQPALPEASLALQIEKRRSLFAYPNELAPMKCVEARLERDWASSNAGGPVAGALSPSEELDSCHLRAETSTFCNSE